MMLHVLALLSSCAVIVVGVAKPAVPRVLGTDSEAWEPLDGSTPNPPDCSVHTFWSTSCGPILSSAARTCSNGGTRLYDNSCKDHFRHGSRGCGLWNLGCQSLCYGVNQDGCASNDFTWKHISDVQFDGHVLWSMTTQETGDCRSACANDPSCQLFEFFAVIGDKDQTRCVFKTDLGSHLRSKGVTSFIKLGAGTVCTTDTLGPDGAFGPFTWSTGAVSAASEDKALYASVPPDGAYPFQNKAEFTVIPQFLNALYQDLWINQDQIAKKYQFTVEAIGNAKLTPDPQEPVGITTSPRWRIGESWRVLNVFRSLLAQGGTHPVNDLLHAQATGALAQALFPDGVRTLLIANENAIISAKRDWLGRSILATGQIVPPFPGVHVAHAGPSGIGFYQRGGVGPMSLEAAFILATQVAGVNWNLIASRAQRARKAVWWVGAITPPRPGATGSLGSCLEQINEINGATRRFGFVSRPASTSERGDGRAGFYVAIDMDPDLGPADPEHNVFVFAVHVIDEHSRVDISKPANLVALRYTQYVPAASDAATPSPGEKGAPPAGAKNAKQARFIAHAHSSYVTYSSLQNFIAQDSPTSFPAYTPLSFLHIYIMNEDDNALWPRSGYLNGAKAHVTGGHVEL